MSGGGFSNPQSKGQHCVYFLTTSVRSSRLQGLAFGVQALEAGETDPCLRREGRSDAHFRLICISCFLRKVDFEGSVTAMPDCCLHSAKLLLLEGIVLCRASVGCQACIS